MNEFPTVLNNFRKTPNENNFAEAMKLAVTSYQCVQIALAHNERGSAFAARAFNKAVAGSKTKNFLTIEWFKRNHGAWWLLFFQTKKMRGLSTDAKEKSGVTG